MDILHWCAANKIHLQKVSVITETNAYGEDVWPVQESYTVRLLDRVFFGIGMPEIVSRSGNTLEEAMASLCATISGKSILRNNTWLKIPQLKSYGE